MWSIPVILYFCSFFSPLRGLKLEVEIKPIFEESPSQDTGLAYRAMTANPAIPEPAIPEPEAEPELLTGREPAPKSEGGPTPQWKPPHWEGYPGGDETKPGWLKSDNIWHTNMKNCTTISKLKMPKIIPQWEWPSWCERKCNPNTECLLLEINFGFGHDGGVCQMKGCPGYKVGNTPKPQWDKPGWRGWQKVPPGWWDVPRGRGKPLKNIK